MKLSELKVDTKSIWFDFDDSMPDFEVELNYIPRSEMSAMAKGCQKTKMNRSTRQVETSLDEDKFVARFAERAIKNWKGLTSDNIQNLVPVEIDGEASDIPFTVDNAVFLIKESSFFDEWVNSKISDVDSFRSRGNGKTGETA